MNRTTNVSLIAYCRRTKLSILFVLGIFLVPHAKVNADVRYVCEEDFEQQSAENNKQYGEPAGTETLAHKNLPVGSHCEKFSNTYYFFVETCNGVEGWIVEEAVIENTDGSCLYQTITTVLTWSNASNACVYEATR